MEKELKKERINVRTTETSLAQLDWVRIALQKKLDKKMSYGSTIEYIINAFYEDIDITSLPTKNK